MWVDKIVYTQVYRLYLPQEGSKFNFQLYNNVYVTVDRVLGLSELDSLIDGQTAKRKKKKTDTTCLRVNGDRLQIESNDCARE